LEEGIKSALPFLGVLNLANLSTGKLRSVSIERAIHQASDESAQDRVRVVVAHFVTIRLALNSTF
jgi:hypothetical protein